MDYTHTGSMVDIIHWAVHYVCGTPFQISDNASDIRNLFMRLGLAVLQKYLTDDYMMNDFAGWLYPTCVTATWVPSRIDVILI